MKRSDTGRLGEELARDFLKKRGFRILESNYRCPEGEIDIIARHKNCLVFIEVRSKTSREFGSPDESVTQAKKKEWSPPPNITDRPMIKRYHYGELILLP